MTCGPRTFCMPACCASPIRARRSASLDEAAIKRAAKGELQIVRDANFVAFVSPIENVAQAAAAAAPQHATWNNVRRITPDQQEAAWLKRPAGRGPSHRRAGTRDAAEERRALHRLAALHRARLDGAVVRAGRVQGRPSHRVVARPGHASLAQEPGAGPRPAARGHYRATPAWRGLLRPQRRRRRRGRCCGDRPAPARQAHSPAMAARGGIRLRAGQTRRC